MKKQTKSSKILVMPEPVDSPETAVAKTSLEENQPRPPKKQPRVTTSGTIISAQVEEKPLIAKRIIHPGPRVKKTVTKATGLDFDAIIEDQKTTARWAKGKGGKL